MTQMTNTETSNNGVVTDGVGISPYGQDNGGVVFASHSKQPPGTMKKAALRDVQNQFSDLEQNHQNNSSFLAGGSNTDAVRVCGNKRLTPECPSGSALYPSLTSSCANEHIMNARRRFELELGRGKYQSNRNKFTGSPQSRQLHQLQLGTPQEQTQLRASNNYCFPIATSNHNQPLNCAFGAPSAPSFLGKHATGLQSIQSDSLKFTLDCPNSAEHKGTHDQHTVERYICLQKLLKECDESNCRDYIQVLRHLSPAELSRHAYEVEARAIQLAMEEGKEIHRMKALNILGKSPLTDNSSQTTSTLTSISVQSTQSFTHPRK